MVAHGIMVLIGIGGVARGLQPPVDAVQRLADDAELVVAGVSNFMASAPRFRQHGVERAFRQRHLMV
ncbi:MAG: hypothetical protein DI601_16995 [Azospirillum brasilense]|nr:MAG: hypothetical protein DI601_16995 [Azospirillum brasilense]